MKLTKPSGQYVKFTGIGDVVEGTFVDYRENVSGKFGPETYIDLESRDGLVHVRCSTVLKNTFSRNRAHLTPGARIRIEFTSTIPSAKGQPTKLFDVDLEPAEVPPMRASASTGPDVHDDEIPF